MQTCSDDTLVAVLQLLRVDVHRPRTRDASAPSSRRNSAKPSSNPSSSRGTERDRCPVRLPARAAGTDFSIVVRTESDDEHRWMRRELHVRPRGTADADGTEDLLVELPCGFASGRHRLRFEHAARHADATVIAAPARLRTGASRRDWGVFAPVYALHERGDGAGDLGTLDRFARWLAPRGGSVVGTLPILRCSPATARNRANPARMHR